ncbi:MAG: hypothetical protein MUF71_08105 [Candidatus Kapabacteria bacterium]|jgi:hypothetical protein|nr:hypothetical protein [Candidatus Kapabacteria bacterium]
MDWLTNGLADQWKNLKSIEMIEATYEINGVSSTERRYFITSLAADASMIPPSARAQWSIENGLYWRLDVQMKEDEYRKCCRSQAHRLQPTPTGRFDQTLLENQANSCFDER